MRVVEEILADESLLRNPAKLSTVAKSKGCPLEVGAAKVFADKVLLDDKAYVLLKEHGHATFLRRLHATTAPAAKRPRNQPPAAAAATAPPPAFGAALPPPLAAVGAHEQIQLRPEVMPAPAAAAPAVVAAAAAAAAAAAFVPEGSPDGGSTAVERRRRQYRNAQNKKRSSSAEREKQALSAWQRRNPGKDPAMRVKRARRL